MPTQPMITKDIVNIETENTNSLTEINKTRQKRFKDFYLQGNSIKRSMLLAGYSKNYVKVHWRDFADRNVNLDAIHNAMRREAGIGGLYSIQKAKTWMKRGTERKAIAGMDHIAKMNRFLNEDKTPTSMHFTLQTIEGENITLNVDKSEKKSVDNSVDAEVIDIKEE